MDATSREYGLVLAGGGTKGAYEVGAWKALKELNINIKAVVGTSIGAINGALFLQDDYSKVLELYNNIEFSDLVKLSKKNEIKSGNIFSPKNIIKFTREFAKNKGLENAPMRNLMNRYIDIEKVYNSPLEYGMVMSSTSKKEKAVELFKEDIAKEDFYDYLLASACYPIFKPQKIGDKEYIDGGVYDNVPINMLIEKGYKNILVIDISNSGVQRKLQSKDSYIKIIKPNDDLGGVFDFDKDRINRNIEMGYLDTLKAFNRLQGHYFYFTIPEFDKLLNVFSLKTIYGLEHAAKLYQMNLYKVYTADVFLEELYDIHKKYSKEYKKAKKDIKDIKLLTKSVRKTQDLISKGMGLCLFMDLVTLQPKYNQKGIVNRFFGEYKAAGESMVELLNYMKE